MSSNSFNEPQNGTDIQHVEQSASMMQQMATAQIQSRYQMALKFPRNIDQVRIEMLRECSRPSFCMPDEKKNGSSIAIYRVPRGGSNIEGKTIRFAEMAHRAFRNLGIDIIPLGEDQNQQILQVNAVDYETNNPLSEIVTVPKSVERNFAKDTDTVISTRTNSKGKPVYTIIGTDDDIAMKRNAKISKAKRNLILAYIPGWLLEECTEQVLATVRKKDAEDPDAARRKLFDAFAQINVTPAQIAEYLGHSNALSPAELEDLRMLFAGIREGYTTWGEIVSAKDDGRDSEDVNKKIEALIAELEMDAKAARNVKTKHIGQPDKLIAYLEGQLAKKKNDGSKAAETKSEPVKEADTTTSSTQPTTTGSQTNSEPRAEKSSSSTQGTQEKETTSEESPKSTPTATTVEASTSQESKPGPVAVVKEPEPTPELPNMEGW